MGFSWNAHSSCQINHYLNWTTSSMFCLNECNIKRICLIGFKLRLSQAQLSCFFLFVFSLSMSCVRSRFPLSFHLHRILFVLPLGCVLNTLWHGYDGGGRAYLDLLRLLLVVDVHLLQRVLQLLVALQKSFSELGGQVQVWQEPQREEPTLTIECGEGLQLLWSASVLTTYVVILPDNLKPASFLPSGGKQSYLAGPDWRSGSAGRATDVH